MIPLRSGTKDEFAELRDVLARARYEEAEICRRLEIGSIYQFLDAPEWRREPEAADPLDLLMRLFLAEEAVEWSRVGSLLDAGDIRILERFGLLHRDHAKGEVCEATVLLYPTESLYIVSDRLTRAAGGGALPADLVYPAITPSAQRFLAVLPTTPCESFLELCAGSGIAALVSGRTAQHTWATDITSRATEFARFNGLLNQAANLTAVQGDLFESVAGRTFDRIAAHPPYAPSVQQEFVWRDGGEDGEQVTRRIIAELPAYLRPGGRFYCYCIATDRKGEPLEQRVRGMLGARAGEFDVALIVAESYHPAEYYGRLVMSNRLPPADAGQHLGTCGRLKVTRIVAGSMVIQRPARARRVFTTRRQLGHEFCSSEIEWLLRWESTRHGSNGLGWMLDLRPVASPNAEWHVAHRMVQGEWQPTANTLRSRIPFDLEAKCPPWTGAFISSCDGRKTLREHLALLPEYGATSAESEQERFLTLAAALVSGGFLLVPEFEPSDPA